MYKPTVSTTHSPRVSSSHHDGGCGEAHKAANDVGMPSRKVRIENDIAVSFLSSNIPADDDRTSIANDNESNRGLLQERNRPTTVTSLTGYTGNCGTASSLKAETHCPWALVTEFKSKELSSDDCDISSSTSSHSSNVLSSLSPSINDNDNTNTNTSTTTTTTTGDATAKVRQGRQQRRTTFTTSDTAPSTSIACTTKTKPASTTTTVTTTKAKLVPTKTKTGIITATTTKAKFVPSKTTTTKGKPATIATMTTEELRERVTERFRKRRDQKSRERTFKVRKFNEELAKDERDGLLDEPIRQRIRWKDTVESESVSRPGEFLLQIPKDNDLRWETFFVLIKKNHEQYGIPKKVVKRLDILPRVQNGKRWKKILAKANRLPCYLPIVRHFVYQDFQISKHALVHLFQDMDKQMNLYMLLGVAPIPKLGLSVLDDVLYGPATVSGIAAPKVLREAKHTKGFPCPDLRRARIEHGHRWESFFDVMESACVPKPTDSDWIAKAKLEGTSEVTKFAFGKVVESRGLEPVKCTKSEVRILVRFIGWNNNMFKELWAKFEDRLAETTPVSAKPNRPVASKESDGPAVRSIPAAPPVASKESDRPSPKAVRSIPAAAPVVSKESDRPSPKAIAVQSIPASKESDRPSPKAIAVQSIPASKESDRPSPGAIAVRSIPASKESDRPPPEAIAVRSIPASKESDHLPPEAISVQSIPAVGLPVDRPSAPVAPKESDCPPPNAPPPAARVLRRSKRARRKPDRYRP